MPLDLEGARAGLLCLGGLEGDLAIETEKVRGWDVSFNDVRGR